MASSSTRFVDAALSNRGPKSLSYIHQNLTWLIRKQVLSLLDDFPTFTPSSDTFTHEDGTSVHLLNISGTLTVSSTMMSPIQLTIWLHQLYPFKPPMVYIFSTHTAQIPFVDASGAITSPYLETWQFPRSNLSDLARNLVNIFSICPPYPSSPLIPSGSCIDHSLASKREALDRLAIRLHYDMACIRAQVEEDIEHMSTVQVMLNERARVISSILQDLTGERASLIQSLMEKVEDADALFDWLTVNICTSPFPKAGFEAFEAADEESKCSLRSEAAECGIDDSVDALGKALEEGVVSFGDYLKQVRALAREQFFHKALIAKLE